MAVVHLWKAFEGRCTCGDPCDRDDDFKAHLADLSAPAVSSHVATPKEESDG